MDQAKKRYSPRTSGARISARRTIHVQRVSDNLGLRVTSAEGLRAKVEGGLPYKSFRTLEGKMRVTTKDLAEMLSIPRSTLSRREQDGAFKTDESDRVYRYADLLALATEMLGNSEEKASLWLQKSRKIFGGHSAIEHAKTEIGAREVEKVIGRIRHGVAV